MRVVLALIVARRKTFAVPLIARRLIFQYFIGFPVQPVRCLIEQLEVPRLDAGPPPVLEVLAEHAFNESRPRLLRSGQAVDSCQQVFR